jgi:GNAT superfamily N-acetyltransferase
MRAMGRRKTKRVATEEDLRKAAEILGHGPLARLAAPPPAAIAESANDDGDDGDDGDDEDPGYYTIRPWTEKAVVDDESEQAFIDEYTGSILHHSDRPGHQRAGRFRAYLVRVNDSREAEIPSFELFDGHSQTLHDYWMALFDPDDYDIKDEIWTKCDVWLSDILIIDYIQILPGHRGHGLGLAVASKLIDLYGGGCGLVAIQPYPLQCNPRFPGDQRAKWFEARMRLEDFPKKKGEATRRLREHWGEQGFMRAGRTGIYILSLSLRRPNIREICDTKVL